MEFGLVVLLGVALWLWARGRERRKEEEREAQWEIRYPQLHEYNADTYSSETRVDFVKMLLVEERSDYDFHQARVFHIRRKDGPVWEMREEYESRNRTRAHLAAKRRDFRKDEEKAEEERYLNDSKLWQAMPAEG